MIDDFTNPQFRPSTLDCYLVRSRILQAVETKKHFLHGRLLDVGCGRMPYRDLLLKPMGFADSYLGLDLAVDSLYSKHAKADITWDGKKIPLDDASIDNAMATELLEHCPDPLAVMREIRRVLRSGGSFFFTVPFLWPLHDVPCDHYRYTPFALENLLRKAGFRDIQIQGLGGWDGALSEMIGLWVRRRPMPSILRSICSLVAFPICVMLANEDKLPTSFGEGQMITGLAGLCRKA